MILLLGPCYSRVIVVAQGLTFKNILSTDIHRRFAVIAETQHGWESGIGKLVIFSLYSLFMLSETCSTPRTETYILLASV